MYKIYFKTNSMGWVRFVVRQISLTFPVFFFFIVLLLRQRCALLSYVKKQKTKMNSVLPHSTHSACIFTLFFSLASNSDPSVIHSFFPSGYSSMYSFSQFPFFFRSLSNHCEIARQLLGNFPDKKNLAQIRITS